MDLCLKRWRNSYKRKYLCPLTLIYTPVRTKDTVYSQCRPFTNGFDKKGFYKNSKYQNHKMKDPNISPLQSCLEIVLGFFRGHIFNSRSTQPKYILVFLNINNYY